MVNPVESELTVGLKEHFANDLRDILLIFRIMRNQSSPLKETISRIQRLD